MRLVKVTSFISFAGEVRCCLEVFEKSVYADDIAKSLGAESNDSVELTFQLSRVATEGIRKPVNGDHAIVLLNELQRGGDLWIGRPRTAVEQS